MKKMVLIFLVLVMPIVMLTAMNHNPFNKHIKVTNPSFANYRDWHVMQRTNWDWNDPSWTESDRLQYHYNAVYTSRVDSVSIWQYDEDSMEWVKQGCTHLTYQPGTMYVTFAETVYSFGPVSFAFIRVYAGYDAQHRLTTWSIYMYDMGNNVWAQVSRMTIVYGAGTTFTVYQWEPADDPDPAMYGKGTFEYDGQGRATMEIWQTSPDSTNWVNDYKTQRTYHPNDTSTGAWFIEQIALNLPLSMIQDDSGPSFGMVSQELESTWNGTAWDNSYKRMYSYNAQDNLTEVLDQNWQTDIWVNEYRETMSYDTNANLAEKISQYYDGTNWQNDDKATYTWSQFTSSDDNTVQQTGLRLAVYPNPFRNRLDIQLDSKSDAPARMEVYNLKGQSVYSDEANANSSIIWNGTDRFGKALPAGIYLLKAIQNGTSVTKKIMHLN